MEQEQPAAWFTEMQKEHEATLTVGQRVRIDLGECPHYLTWHGWIEQGLTGTIIDLGHVRLLGSPDDHPYMVLFDQPVQGKGTCWAYGDVELVPITTEAWMAAMLAPLNLP